MKVLLYIVILAAVLLVPTRGTDVGKLIPVEVIAVSENRGLITVRTDTGDTGEGNTLAEAFSDLKDTASGVIYLDTAEYLLLEPGTENAIPELQAQLKGNLRICTAPEDISLEGAAKYLSVHPSEERLNKVETEKIPFLSEENGRYQLKEK